MSQQSQSHDPLEEFPEWSANLKASVIPDLDPLAVAETAQLAARAAAAASLTTAAGSTGAIISGGTSTMTSATMSAATATNVSILSTLGGKIGAAILATAVVAGGAAVTGNLAVPATSDVAPVTSLLDGTVDGTVKIVETASGSLSLDLTDEGLQIIDLVALEGWTATVTNQTTSELSVAFSDATGTVTVDAAIDEAGAIVTTVSDKVAAQVDEARNLLPEPVLEAPQVGGNAGAGTDITIGAGVAGDSTAGSAEGSAQTDVSIDTGLSLN